jgi:hypothetical protein
VLNVERPQRRYEVVFNTRTGMPSSYKGVREWPLHTADGFVKLELFARTVYVHITDEIVSYSVRELEDGNQPTVRKLPMDYAPHRPEAAPADDFNPEGGTSA